MPSNTAFVFSDLLSNAIEDGDILGGDDTEGYPFSPVPPPSLRPATPENNQGVVSPFGSPLSSLDSDDDDPSLPRRKKRRSLASRHAPSATRGRKLKSKERKRLCRQRDAVGGLLSNEEPRLTSKESATGRHIRPSKPLRTTLQTRELEVTSTGFVAKLDRNPTKGLFCLSDMVGGGSEFGFKLRRWDGR